MPTIMHAKTFSPGMSHLSFFYIFIYLVCLIGNVHMFYPYNDSTNDQNE
jgi:hypothetical protein